VIGELSAPALCRSFAKKITVIRHELSLVEALQDDHHEQKQRFSQYLQL